MKTIIAKTRRITALLFILLMVFSCASCTTVKKPVCEHTFIDTVHEATCTEGGYTEHICSACGEKTKDTETDALGHDFQAGEVTLPTYEADGFTEYVCSRCGEKENRDVTAKLIPPEEICVHDYTDKVVEATCTEAGYTEHTCSKCNGVVRDNEVAALGHDYKKGSVVAPTYDAKGYTNYTCSRCGKTEKRDYVAKLVNTCTHSYSDTVVAVTCTSDGYTNHVCSKCGHSYKDNTVKSTGHKYTLTEETSTYKRYTCSVCGNVKTEQLGEHTHNWVFTRNVAPTCDSSGYSIVTCSICGEETQTLTGYAAALGHKYSSTWTVEVAATATTEGKEYQTCSRCGAKNYRTIPKVGSGDVVRVDKFTCQLFPAVGAFTERMYYEAEDYNPLCFVSVTDYQRSRPATVLHTGYLAFKVTFYDNTDTQQVISFRYDRTDAEVYKYYSGYSLYINIDGSYILKYGTRLQPLD